MSSDQHSREEFRTRTLGESIQNGHDLVTVTEWLPGEEPTDYGIDLSDSPRNEYKARYWRCQNCGQERNRRSEFRDQCPEEPKTPLSDGGYSIDEPRTRRALLENMDVRFEAPGGQYTVNSESGKTYATDVVEQSCSCPDHQKRGVVCKHLRRVTLEICAEKVPGPAGKFGR